MKFIELTAVSGDNVMINLDRVVKVVESAETGSVVVYTTDGLKENFICNQSKKLIEAVKGKTEFKPEHGTDKPHAKSMAESMTKKYSTGGIVVSNDYRDKQAKRQTTVDYLIKYIENDQKNLANILRQQLETIKVNSPWLEEDATYTLRLLHDYETKFHDINELSADELQVFTGDLRFNVEKLRSKYIKHSGYRLDDYIPANLGDVMFIAGKIDNVSRTMDLVSHYTLINK